MYIKHYWGEYIGGTDDSLNLVSYLREKAKEALPLTEIFQDLGLDQFEGNFARTVMPVQYTLSNGVTMDFLFAIDVITDLAALLLECKKSGSVNLRELDEYSGPDFAVRITAGPEELEILNLELRRFAEDPLHYDLSELVPEEDMKEMAETCEKLRLELIE